MNNELSLADLKDGSIISILTPLILLPPHITRQFLLQVGGEPVWSISPINSIPIPHSWFLRLLNVYDLLILGLMLLVICIQTLISINNVIIIVSNSSIIMIIMCHVHVHVHVGVFTGSLG